MRILAWLVHAVFDPLGIGLGVFSGLVVRRVWQAGLTGAVLGFLAAAILAQYHHEAVAPRAVVTAAIVSGGWGIVIFWLRGWLRAAK